MEDLDLDIMIFKLVANGDERWRYERCANGIAMCRRIGDTVIGCWLSCNDGIVSESVTIDGVDNSIIIDETKPFMRFDIRLPQFDPDDLVKFIQDDKMME